jgi:hypothetical protein
LSDQILGPRKGRWLPLIEDSQDLIGREILVVAPYLDDDPIATFLDNLSGHGRSLDGKHPVSFLGL